MNRWIWAVCLVGLLSTVEAHAAVIDPATATFQWAAPVVDATHDAATGYNIKCGPTTGVYTVTYAVPMPYAPVPITKVVSTPGTYFCAVTGVNLVGESAPSNEVTFQIGVPPVVVPPPSVPPVPNQPFNLSIVP